MFSHLPVFLAGFFTDLIGGLVDFFSFLF